MSNFNEYNIRQVSPAFLVQPKNGKVCEFLHLQGQSGTAGSQGPDLASLLDSRFRDRMQAILILKVQAITKDKWGFYNFLPKSYFFDVSQVLDFYDTTEELDPLT